MSSPTTTAAAAAAAATSAAAKAIDPKRAAESNLAWIMTVITIFFVLSLIFVGMRMYCRIVLVRSFGRDDVAMVLCSLCTTAAYAIFCYWATLGLGKHNDTIPRENQIKYSRAGTVNSIIQAGFAIGFLKISIGFNLLRLSPAKWYKWSLWTVIFFVVGVTFHVMFVFLFQCRPLAGAWDKSIKAECMPINVFLGNALSNTAFNIFTDVFFATIPIPIIWQLKMKRKVKMYLVGILSLGYVAVVMGALKAVWQIAFSWDKDKTFTQGVQFWGFLQLTTGTMAACAATLKPLFNRVLKLGSEQYYGTPGRYYASRGTKLTDHHGAGTKAGTRRGDHVELESAVRTSEEEGKPVAHGPGENYSTATSFYKHGSPTASGSEEMILGSQGNNGGMLSPHSMPNDDGRGIICTTEVRVSVKDK